LYLVGCSDNFTQNNFSIFKPIEIKVVKMGMFSWCCKGCGYELIHGETVRLNGQKQVYDGYGGLADIDFDDVSAWHDK
jgi:hypothetical protein